MPDAKLVWLDAGHFVLDENTPQVAAEIKATFAALWFNPSASKEFLMPKLLYIKASPRGTEAKSSAVADAYLEALRGRFERG